MFPPFSSSFCVDDLIRNRMKPPPNWRHGFAEYISTLPSYYAQVCHCSCQCLSLVCHCSSQCLSLVCHCSSQCLSVACHCSCQCLSQVPVAACVRICHRCVITHVIGVSLLMSLPVLGVSPCITLSAEITLCALKTSPEKKNEMRRKLKERA